MIQTNRGAGYVFQTFIENPGDFMKEQPAPRENFMIAGCGSACPKCGEGV